MTDTASRSDRTVPDGLLDAALDVAAERGWRAVTPNEVSVRMKGEPVQLAGCGPFRVRLLAALADRTDAAMRDGLDDDARDATLPLRDRLFEALMARLDALAQHRVGTLAVLRGVPLDPPSALAALPLLGRSMARTLDAVGESPRPPFGPLKVKGLSVVWLATLRAWLKDDSPDMAVTMKALDAALGRAEEAANSLLRGARRRAPEPAPDG